MKRIAIIGAGSIVFCKTLMLDIMATPELEDTEFVLMAPSTGKISQVKALADKVIERNGLKSKVTVGDAGRSARMAAANTTCSRGILILGYENMQKSHPQRSGFMGLMP